MDDQYSRIFADTRQAVRFAFALDAYKIGSQGAAVRLALADARVTSTPTLPEGTDAHQLRAHAARILRTMQGQMLRPESASLAAAFSRDTDARRRAIVTLHPLFCTLLTRLIGNGALVGKLMRRHYLPLQERDAKWELHALAEEFKVGRERVARAAQAVDRYARQIEADALASLGELLNPIPAPPAAQPQPQQEVAHA